MATSGSGKTTTVSQRSFILKWLENPANVRLIAEGTQAGPAIAGKKLKKIDVYIQLTAFINLKLKYTDPPDMWDQKTTKVRYESLVKPYKNTRDKYQDHSEGSRLQWASRSKRSSMNCVPTTNAGLIYMG